MPSRRSRSSFRDATASPPIDANVLTLLAGACRDHVRLRFAYLDREGAASRREAEPYRLVNWGRRWYLVAWDIDREAWRTFRVDRIEPRLPLGARFTPRPLPDEDVAAYVARGVTGSGWGFRAQVIVRAPADCRSGAYRAMDRDRGVDR
jgi:predicted DNA-binding transcriptional regulator YafY